MQSSEGSHAFQNARPQEQAEALLQAAVAAYHQGRHGEAQALCQQILKDLPNHFGALHVLGTSQVNSSRFKEAVATLTLAIGVDPRSPDAQSSLGTALSELGRYDEARRCQEKAIALRPNFPMALTNLGKTLVNLGELDAAFAAYDRAVALKPDFADAYCHRGQAMMLMNRAEEADRDFSRALSLNPQLMAAVLGKALVNIDLRNFEVALTHMNAMLAAFPTAAGVLAQRGRLYMEMAELDKAEADFDDAIRNDPRQETALCEKANLLLLRGDVAQAAPLCQRALEVNPHSEAALARLGTCFAAVGDPVTAIAYFDRVLARTPNNEEAIVKKIVALDFVPDIDFATLQEARKYWWDQIGARQPQRQLQARSLDPERRIVIGYVSADFRDHSAAIAFMPLLRHRDRERFQVICYSNWPVEDATTAYFKSLADHWVDAWRLTDDKLAKRIEADRVDILVDLSGHSGGNRLSLFATKPAPVQVSAIGNVSGTGLPTMDYLLADPILIPPAARPLFAEKVHDLPAFITLEPPPQTTATPLPALGNGYVTFGVFNRADKISDAALALWSRLMQAVPGSVIVVKSGALDDALVRDTLIARFVASGIPEHRLRCIGLTPRPEHLALVTSIDIMLDPFPQNGGVSTWEPLQLGVPVVTKLGNGHASRCGGAIVVAAGLGDWVAEDDEGYVEIARRWASSPGELAALRTRLPAQVASSPAGNCVAYVGYLEQGYRKFWREYCASAARR